MANKREFKKSVEALGATICEEMMATYYNVENADRDAIAKSIEKVLVAVTRAKDNANVSFDRGVKAFESKEEYAKTKAKFFKALFVKVNEELAQEINDALNVFNKALPEEIKQQNKAAVAE